MVKLSKASRFNYEDINLPVKWPPVIKKKGA